MFVSLHVFFILFFSVRVHPSVKGMSGTSSDRGPSVPNRLIDYLTSDLKASSLINLSVILLTLFDSTHIELHCFSVIQCMSNKMAK